MASSLIPPILPLRLVTLLKSPKSRLLVLKLVILFISSRRTRRFTRTRKSLLSNGNRMASPCLVLIPWRKAARLLPSPIRIRVRMLQALILLKYASASPLRLSISIRRGSRSKPITFTRLSKVSIKRTRLFTWTIRRRKLRFLWRILLLASRNRSRLSLSWIRLRSRIRL